MGHIQWRVVFTARSPEGKQRTLLRNRFGLDEELIKGRVLAIGIVGGHGKFNVTGQVQDADPGGAIDQGDPAHLHIVFRRDDDLGFAMDSVIDAPEYGPVQGKVNRIPFDFPSGGMIGAGPETIRIGLMNVAEGPLGITGRIRPPAGEFPAAPLTVAAAAVGDHQVITAIGKQQTPGGGGMGRGEGRPGRCHQVLIQNEFRRSLSC